MNRPQIIINALKNENGPFFLGLPERWLDNPTFRCEGGHVMKYYIKSERLGYNACPTCEQPVWTTFPEDLGVNSCE
jgi:hypothetical protein